jgi:hypothetical protein
VVATGGAAAAIAAAAPNPKSASADYTGGKTAVPAGNSGGTAGNGAGGVTGSGSSAGTGIAPPNDRPESSTGDEQTTSGGS